MNNNILECNCIKDSAKSIMLSLLDRTDKMESDISSILLLISQGNLLNVGISSIILTVVSTENGGTNVVTITKTDGTLSTFQFKNGDKGDAFVYSNFTQEQISNLQKPAADAAVLANSAAQSANTAASSANTASGNAETAATNANDTASRVAQAEDLRVTAETTRVTSEATRVESENTRVTNESTRVTNESTRVTAENTRVTAENARATEFNTLKNNLETATNNANGAATKAIEAAANVKDGAAATILIGTVASGTTASVTNSGTTNAAKLDFVLPKGDTGTAATVTVGTVTTGAAGSSASVTNSGTSSAAVLNITIPKGDAGTGASVVQETGTSTEDVMSQKAVTDLIFNSSITIADIYKCFNNLNCVIYEDTDGIIHKKIFYTTVTVATDWGLGSDRTSDVRNKIAKIYSVTATSNMTDILMACSFLPNLTYVDAASWNVSNVTRFCDKYYHGVFFNCNSLTYLDLSTWNVQNATTLTNFIRSNSLINYKSFTGPRVSYSLNYCVKLSHDSLITVLTGLADMTTTDNQTWATSNSLTTTPTLTLGSVNLAKLTDAEKSIATNKNWILA